MSGGVWVRAEVDLGVATLRLPGLIRRSILLEGFVLVKKQGRFARTLKNGRGCSCLGYGHGISSNHLKEADVTCHFGADS